MQSTMKRITTALLVGMLMFGGIGFSPLNTQASNTSIIVQVDGVRVHFPDQQPVIVDGRILVPLRAAMEAIGFYVEWDDAIDSAILTKPHPQANDHQLQLMIPMRNITSQSFFATTAGSYQHLHGNIYTRANKIDASPMSITTTEVPPQNINGRVMVPLRVIAEIAGMEPQWNESTRTANIFTTSTPAPTSQTPQLPAPTPIPQTAPTSPLISTWSIASSQITLPNRRLTATERQEWIDEFNNMGGATDFEIEIIRLINEIRVEHNLTQVQKNNILSKATRFYVQTKANLNLSLSHTAGPYGGSAGTVSAFGGSWNAANGAFGTTTPQATVDMWMGSPGHRANILNPTIRTIGIGAYQTEQGRNFVYMLASNAY